jgi:hypothetical protein
VTFRFFGEIETLMRSHDPRQDALLGGMETIRSNKSIGTIFELEIKPGCNRLFEKHLALAKVTFDQIALHQHFGYYDLHYGITHLSLSLPDVPMHLKTIG